jgi:hypothetical protein
VQQRHVASTHQALCVTLLQLLLLAAVVLVQRLAVTAAAVADSRCVHPVAIVSAFPPHQCPGR